jgi:hypothetical protein
MLADLLGNLLQPFLGDILERILLFLGVLPVVLQFV